MHSSCCLLFVNFVIIHQQASKRRSRGLLRQWSPRELHCLANHVLRSSALMMTCLRRLRRAAVAHDAALMPIAILAMGKDCIVSSL